MRSKLIFVRNLLLFPQKTPCSTGVQLLGLHQILDSAPRARFHLGIDFLCNFRRIFLPKADLLKLAIVMGADELIEGGQRGEFVVRIDPAGHVQHKVDLVIVASFAFIADLFQERIEIFVQFCGIHVFWKMVVD